MSSTGYSEVEAYDARFRKVRVEFSHSASVFIIDVNVDEQSKLVARGDCREEAGVDVVDIVNKGVEAGRSRYQFRVPADDISQGTVDEGRHRHVKPPSLSSAWYPPITDDVRWWLPLTACQIWAAWRDRLPVLQ